MPIIFQTVPTVKQIDMGYLVRALVEIRRRTLDTPAYSLGATSIGTGGPVLDRISDK